MRKPAPVTTKRRVGRPARVSAASIVAAALDIGLERATLKLIAERLGVAQATLYRHVANRDELLRLAAFEVTLARRLPDAAAAHWSELAARYAESLYESFLAEPALIGELLKGRLGPHAEVDVLEQFLDAMAAHGFHPKEALRLFHAIGTLVIGAAAGAIGHTAASERGKPWHFEVRRTLARRDPADAPRVRSVLPRALETQGFQWLPALHALLQGFAAERDETLPRTFPRTAHAARPASR